MKLNVGMRAGVAIVALAAAVACDEHVQRASAPRADTQQAPPAIRHDEHVFAAGIAPPGTTLVNPYRGDRSSIAAGEQWFGAMNCDGCHGAGAAGSVGPSLSDGRWRYGGSDAAVFQSIYYGRPHGMPAFGGAMPSQAIWKIVSYLQSLQPPADVPTESWR